MIRNSNALKKNSKVDDKNEISMQEILNSIRGTISTDVDNQPAFDEFNYKDDKDDLHNKDSDDVLVLTDAYEEKDDDNDIINHSLAIISAEDSADKDNENSKAKLATNVNNNISNDDTVIRGLFEKFDRQKINLNKSNFNNITEKETENHSSLTIEQLAKDAMQPLIEEWIENNLPNMVEKIVTAEIRKIIKSRN